MIKFQHKLDKDQKHIYGILCCDCYFDLIFYLLRRNVTIDKIENRFSNLSNCYYSVCFSTVIVSCYKMLKFIITNNMMELYGCDIFSL